VSFVRSNNIVKAVAEAFRAEWLAQLASTIPFDLVEI
jgi:hypothetical protein